MKRVMESLFVLFLFVLLIGIFFVVEVGADDDSTTIIDFNIAGCALPGSNSGGLAINTCSRGEIDGEYYCDDDKFLWKTRDGGYGCSLGSAGYVLGSPFCCPAGMFCNETSGGFKCDYRLEQCGNMTNEPDCNAIGCIWLEMEGICADGTRDYGCSLYTDSSSCLNDTWNLGRSGLGTDICGSYIECDGVLYTIPYESCECVWNVGSGVCELYMDGTQTYYNDEEVKDWFSCLKDYDVGDCVDGEQDVSWTATNEIYNDFPEECLDMVGCSDGSLVRSCGEPIIKLPGFSLFALFSSVFIFGTYYLIEGFK